MDQKFRLLQKTSKRSISDDDEKDKKALKKLKTEVKEKDKEISKLKKKIDSLKLELKEASEKIQRSESLNIQLQKHVIDKFMEQTGELQDKIKIENIILKFVQHFMS